MQTNDRPPTQFFEDEASSASPSAVRPLVLQRIPKIGQAGPERTPSLVANITAIPKNPSQCKYVNYSTRQGIANWLRKS